MAKPYHSNVMMTAALQANTATTITMLSGVFRRKEPNRRSGVCTDLDLKLVSDESAVYCLTLVCPVGDARSHYLCAVHDDTRKDDVGGGDFGLFSLFETELEPNRI